MVETPNIMEGHEKTESTKRLPDILFNAIVKLGGDDFKCLCALDKRLPKKDANLLCEMFVQLSDDEKTTTITPTQLEKMNWVLEKLTLDELKVVKRVYSFLPKYAQNRIMRIPSLKAAKVLVEQKIAIKAAASKRRKKLKKVK